jgi:hypothetical protein
MPDETLDPTLWEVAEDVCLTCGKHLGFGVRWLHVKICEECQDREPPDPEIAREGDA